MTRTKEITIVISSRKQGDECEDFITQIKDTCGVPAKVIFVTNDGAMGLSELYAGMLINQNITSVCPNIKNITLFFEIFFN